MSDFAELTKFATRYAKAWCSQNPEKCGGVLRRDGSLSVNDGRPAAIAEVARGFMRDFPDMIVTFNKLEQRPNGTAFHWTLTGTNTGPGGTGKQVRISSYELWQIDNDGLIAESKAVLTRRSTNVSSGTESMPIPGIVYEPAYSAMALATSSVESLPPMS